MPPGLRREKEARIRGALHALPEVKAARVLGCYVGVHSEVDTRVFIEEALMDGQRVAVPVVRPPERMELAEVRSLGELVPGAHGIPEPPPPHALLLDADALVLPGLLFTRDGHRLGNGGGYFDRLLRRIPRATRIGVCFAEQLVGAVPREAHDEVMDIVVTDEGVYRSTRAA
jgi:5-formyltetrahydrofolate cyclo-ligase